MPLSSTTGKRRQISSRRSFKLRGVTYCVMLACADASWANPSGASIAAGAASLHTAGKTLTVTNAPGTIINWNSFSIGAGEHTRFLQQSAASAVLNRVVGRDASSILGALSSNGRVFLVNPHGIVFGPGAVINTAGFIASTLNISDQDFLQGRLRFEGGGGGILRNEGTLRASGDIMLVGPAIENAGIIRSDAGSVVLAAGKAVTITSPDAHGVTFTLQAPSDTAVNLGTIEAGNAVGMFAGTLRHSGDIHIVNGGLDGAGRLLLVAQNDAVVQSGSTMTASGAQGGSITVQSGGQTLVSGAIDASGIDKGGSIQLLGRNVGVLAGATVDASGGAGGGTILIGGDYKGANPAVQNALHTYIGADATIRADATTSGDGGRVIVWSDEATRVHGLISARGAGPTSKGGFVETSGHYLEVTRAPEIGAGGTWLLDPRNISVVSTATIDNSGPPSFTPTGDDSEILNTQINAQLDAGTNVVLDTNSGGGTQAGNIIVDAQIIKTNTNTASLTFNAQNDVTINAAVNLAPGGDINVTTGNTTSTMTVNRVVTAGNAMNLNLAGGLVVQSSTGQAAQLLANTGQTITARFVEVIEQAFVGASIRNNFTGPANASNQSITTSGMNASGEGLVLRSLGGSGPAATIFNSSTGTQTITVNDAQFLRVGGGGGSSGGFGSWILANTGPQIILAQGNIAGGNAIIVGVAGATGFAQIAGRNQSITAGTGAQSGSITIVGGGTDGTNGSIVNQSGPQSISATNAVNITGGNQPNTSSPVGAFGLISNTGTAAQIISAGAIALQGGSVGSNNQGFIRSDGSQDVTVGVGGISIIGGTGVANNLASIFQASAAATQAVTINNGGSIVIQGGSGSGSGNSAQLTGSGPSQQINFTAGGNIQLTGGTNGTLNTARILETATASTSTQTITGAAGITLTGGANGGGVDVNNNALGNFADIRINNGSQTISVGTGGITMTGGGGPLTNNSATIAQALSPNVLVTGTSQNITINNGGTLTMQGGSSAQMNVIGGANNPNNFFRGSFTNIQSNGDTQHIDFPNGGAISLTGGTVGSNNVAQIQLRFGNNQMITGAPAITLTGGASGGTQNGTVNEGNRARIIASVGDQNITAGAISLTGGALGMLNSAQIITSAAGTTQTIDASGIMLRGGPGGGGFVTGPFSTRGNFAQINAGGDQTVTVGAAGIVMTGGGGTLTDNFASLIQNDPGANRRQQITVNDGGPITLTGGSSAATSAGVSGSGSFAFITADGAAGQTIDFVGPPASAITLTGGTVGTGNNVGLLARAGPQTITGSPTITMIGGASGGIAGDNNSATIEATLGTQTITAGTTQVTGGPGGVDNSATIRSPNQNITVNGNLTQTGSTGGSGATGARIGPLNNQAGTTSVTVTGNLTLNGGGVASSGASIGISGQATVMQNATFTVNAGGDVMLNGGTAGFARMGQPAGLLGGGDVSVTATNGNIVLGGNASTGGQVNTAGNVTLRADNAGRSIFEVGANSLIRANTLTAVADSGITLDGNNAVTNLNASNATANGVQFTQTAGSLLTVTGMAQTGGQVRVTADDLNITGTINAGANPVTLRPTTLSRPVNIENTTPTAGTLSLSTAELNFIIANVLDVGRFDGTGNLSLSAGFANTDINPSTFRVLSGNDISITGAFGGTGTEFNNGFQALANNNLNITGTTLLFADGQTVSLRADHDASGAGNLTIANSSGSAKTINAGTSAANTASMTLQGRDITVGGGSDGMFVAMSGTGTQTVAATGNLLVQAAGTVQGNTGIQASNGAQNVSAAGITLNAANSGSNNSATIVGASQAVTVGAGGIVANAGQGTSVNSNTAAITQTGTTGTQTITVNNGGPIQLTAGSGSGSQSTAQIAAFGVSQQINFGAGSAITLTGGMVGTANAAQIRSVNGTQTITGSPSLNMTGGSSGGAADNGNFARLFAMGAQTLTLGATQLVSGSGGSDNFASIQSPNQTITVNGNLTLTGSSGTTGAAGARIGAIRDGVTNLALTVSGAVALAGGSTTNGGAALGPSALSTVMQPANITLTAGGDVTLGGGTVAGTRIGHPANLVGGGDIVVDAGGNIAIDGSATGIAAVRTTGNATLRANNAGKSVNSGPNSVLQANILTAQGNAGVTLAGTNQINQLNVASAGNINFTAMQSIDVSNSTVTTPAGPQTVTITTIGATSDITVSGTVTSDDNFVLTSGRDVIFNGGADITALNATLAGPGSAQFPSGTVTLNTPVTSAMPFNISGAIVNANGSLTLNSGLTLSGGAVQGAGALNINGGAFAWSGGTVTGTGLFVTPVATTITGPVGFHTRMWNNTGAVSETGAARVTLLNNAVINNQAGGTWDISSTDTMPMLGGGTFNNAGIFRNSGVTPHTVAITAFTNTGQLSVDAGVLTLPTFPINDGMVNISAGATLSTSGAGLFNNGIVGGGGRVMLSGATLMNNNIVAPGASPGTLVIDGNYSQGPNGVLAIDIGGPTQGVDYDLLRVTGTASLNGTLRVAAVNGFTPSPGSVFDFLTYASRSGDFTSITSSGGIFTVQPVPNLTSYGVLTTSSASSAVAQMIAAVSATNVITLSESSPGSEESRAEEEKARSDTAQTREEQAIKASEQQCR